MRFLLVYCGHDDSTSANGVCVWNIARELRRRGHQVWAIWQFKDVIDREFEKNDVHCYGIGESWYYTLTQWHKTHRNFFFDMIYKCVSALRLLYAMPLYPNISPLVSLRCRRLVNRIVKEKGIDRVVGFYMPYHAIDTTLYLKRKYGEKLFVANYHLDLISSPINTNKIVRQYKLWKGGRAVEHELKLIDRMLLPMSAKDITNSEKIRYVDFPLFVKSEQYKESGVAFREDCINITYIGSLDKSNRNPSFILSTLKKCVGDSSKEIVVHIWGGLADKETRDIIEGFDFVTYHGLLDNQYVTDVLRRSDFLLNVSNGVTYDMIPSKIFQLFSMHKPIINVVRNEKDKSLAYFQKYPNVLNINEYAPADDSAKTLTNFLENATKGEVTYNDDFYVESTPEYICDYLDSKQ